MSNSKAVVLKKVTLKAERQNEWNVHHVFAGSIHLPKCYVTGQKGAYYIHAYEANEDGRHEILGGLGRGIYNMKAAREWIANYDVNYEAKKAEEAAEQQAQEEAREERRAAIDAQQAVLTSDVEDNTVFTVGTRINAKFASLNKNGSIGEYGYLCSLVEKDAERKYWDKNQWNIPSNWSIAECEVVNIVELTDDEFDVLCANLMDSEICMEAGICTGGTGSDADLPEDWDWITGTEAERDLYRAQAYELVSVVTAPNRAPFVAQGSGHVYARYVGLEPTNK